MFIQPRSEVLSMGQPEGPASTRRVPGNERWRCGVDRSEKPDRVERRFAHHQPQQPPKSSSLDYSPNLNSNECLATIKLFTCGTKDRIFNKVHKEVISSSFSVSFRRTISHTFTVDGPTPLLATNVIQSTFLTVRIRR